MFFQQKRRTRSKKIISHAVECLETRRLMAVTVFYADFEGTGGAASTDGFTYSAPTVATGYANTNLWHTSTLRAQSPTHAMYYGQDTTRNYDTAGLANAGTITSPSISLVGRTNASLQFKYFLSAENPSLSPELINVQISTNGGSNWTDIAVSGAGLTNDAAWHTFNASLNSYIGNNILVRFNFDTVDEFANQNEGWFVDDVIVSDPAGDPAPYVSSVSPADGSSISTTSTTIQYVFSEAVSNVDVTDLTISGSAVAGTTTVSGVTPVNSTTYNFTVSGLINGVLNATLAKDTGDIVDSGGQSVLPFVTKYAVFLPDRYETNDTFGAATNLGVISGVSTQSNLSLHNGTEVDYYKFTAAATGAFTFDINYNTNLTLWDIAAYDNAQAAITDTNPAENTIAFNITAGQVYYIKVSTDPELQEPTWSYDMTFNAPSPTVTIAATDASAGETGPNTGTYTVTRSSTVGAMTVNYVVSGTATSGSDFQSLSGTVNLTAGTASATITLTPIDDNLVESAETVIVTLSAGTGYTVGTPSNATVTIADSTFPAGDFNRNGSLSATDIDQLSAAIRAGTNNPFYDLTGDGLVNSSDMDNLVQVKIGTKYGDANLDKQVNLNDASLMLTNWGATSGKGWAQGDFNGDGQVNLNDASLMLTNWGWTAPAAPVTNPASDSAPASTSQQASVFSVQSLYQETSVSVDATDTLLVSNGSLLA